jgi:hypothetical protein
VSEDVYQFLGKKAESCSRDPLTQSQKYLYAPRAIIRNKQEYEGFCCWCPVSSTYTLIWRYISNYYYLSITFADHFMNLLLFLSCCIGEFDTWPSNIFRLLFIDNPHPAAIRDVSAFFYGNNLSLRYASLFYVICNEEASLHSINTMFTLYSLWYTHKNNTSSCKIL